MTMITINSTATASLTIHLAGHAYPQLVIFNRGGRFTVTRPAVEQAVEPFDPRLDRFVGLRIWGQYTDRDLERDINAALA